MSPTVCTKHGQKRLWSLHPDRRQHTSDVSRERNLSPPRLGMRRPASMPQALFLMSSTRTVRAKGGLGRDLRRSYACESHSKASDLPA